MPPAAGRAASYGEIAGIKQWLDPFTDSPQCFGYPADRSVKATDKALLCNPKYQKLFEEGHDLIWP